MKQLMFLAALAVLILSCDGKRVYETNQDFDNGLWPLRDTARFIFTVDDTTQTYNVFINVRNTIDYETARLFMNYTLLDSSNKPIRKRLLEYMLFDRKTGEPFGDSGLGDIYDHQFAVETNHKFPYRGSYTVKLSHMMRTDSLREILSVGTRVERVQ